MRTKGPCAHKPFPYSVQRPQRYLPSKLFLRRTLDRRNMAEAVNFLIENEVSEAQLYERAAVFTTHEIQDIFKKRSRFEYLLRRRRVDASCYTNYIKFEQNLIELLRLREVLMSSLSLFSFGCFFQHDDLISKESTIAQAHRGHGSALVRAVCHSFISKVVVLYRRALRETKGNVGLWLRFATFCHQHGNRRLLSRVITQALQMNPSCAGLWAFAAFWEYTSQVPQRTDFSSYPSSWKAIIQALKT